MTTDHYRRCEHWIGGVRCNAQATHRFLVDSQPANVAGNVCQEHGEAIIAEYREHADALGRWELAALAQRVACKETPNGHHV